MTPEISERALEAAIECALLAYGPDACPGDSRDTRESTDPFGEAAPGGYRKRLPDDYDRALCLLPRDLFDFLYATQPREWERLKQQHGDEVKDRFLDRLATEVGRRGTLDVLRRGVKDSGCKFRLAYFRPSSGLNEELQRLYAGNLFSVVRQLHYSRKNENSLDMGLFLNGLPIFTVELKNPLTGQKVKEAVRQYRYDRDRREPLFAPRRCLAHFAIDPDWVFVTTRLEGPQTRFLPFNRGNHGGAGNPPSLPSEAGYATDYLWNRIWARDSVLNLIQHFIHEVEDDNRKGRRAPAARLIFPRYHQLDSVRRLVHHARAEGPGRRYLIQHSAGSGKSNSIAWLAHQLSVLHDVDDRRVFDSIIVVTDRRVLDRQLQRTIRQFEQTAGVVENIDQTSKQLRTALEEGKTIIVTTLQKFPVIVEDIGALTGKNFAVIIDEAHSSQAGESSRSLKAVLSATTLEEAEQEEADAETPDEETERLVLESLERRGPLSNLSTFAFTATPKAKTLELFGRKRPDGRFEAFSLYSMRQAIEEGFILDVLENYTTYKTYWALLKKIKDDPRYEKEKASHLLRSFVGLHRLTIRKRLEIIVEHFHGQVAARIGGRAKAMIVTPSRLHAVRYQLGLTSFLREKGYPYRSLVAFSGTVKDAGVRYTEAGMNGVSERQTAQVFGEPEYRFLVVANKFQTGFDMPLLHTMYVDKKLGGVNAVQTLSRLNRVHPDKTDTMVLDFVNEADDIRKGFEPYYEKTLLSEQTDPNLLYDLETRLVDSHLFEKEEVEAFARVYFTPKATQDRLYAVLRPVVERYRERSLEDRVDFRKQLTDFVRLYAFLSQIIRFRDPDLEKLYHFARYLRRYLPQEESSLPLEVQQAIDMDSYRVEKTGQGAIKLPRGAGKIDPKGAGGKWVPVPDPIEALSAIIRELNERFGTDFTPEDKVFIRQLEEQLAGDPSLTASVRANTPENARLTFDHVVNDRLQELVDTNFKFYKKVTDDRDFARYFLDWLFERYRKAVESQPNE